MRWKASNPFSGERDQKVRSLYPARSHRMVFVLFRGEGWGEGPGQTFLNRVVTAGSAS
jgi:hypothetical protein